MALWDCLATTNAMNNLLVLNPTGHPDSRPRDEGASQSPLHGKSKKRFPEGSATTNALHNLLTTTFHPYSHLAHKEDSMRFWEEAFSQPQRAHQIQQTHSPTPTVKALLNCNHDGSRPLLIGTECRARAQSLSRWDLQHRNMHLGSNHPRHHTG